MKSEEKKISSLSNQEIKTEKVQGGTKKAWDANVDPASLVENANESSLDAGEPFNRPDVRYKSVFKARMKDKGRR
jgi:hypothetical protein